MKNIEKVVIPVIIIVIITMLGIYYISKEYQKQQYQQQAEDEQEEITPPVEGDDLVYMSTAMLVGKDAQKQKLKFISVENDKLMEFDHTENTPILGKHGNYLTLDQIPLGEIFDVTYSIVNKELLKLKVSEEAWTYTDVTKFSINEKEKRMEIAGSTYKLPKTSIVSYGDELATFMDVTDTDTLTVKGYGRKVCSIIVERGHGYIRLVNDSYFEGGWIEIGQEIISEIGKEMLIPVPEGNYHVRLTNKGYAAEEDVTIERDKETVIDLSKADIKEVAIGHVLFTIVPDFAHLFIDGDMTDYEERVPLEFGIHKVHVELAGYKSVDINIRVSDQYADVEITLEEEDTDSTTKKTTTRPKNGSGSTATPRSSSTTTALTSSSYLPTSLTVPVTAVPAPYMSSSEYEASTTSYSPPVVTVIPTPEPDTSSSETTTEKTSTTKKTTEKPSTTEEDEDDDDTTEKDTTDTDPIIGELPRLYVESPEDAEIYVDGIYVGITPLSFIKPDAGSHVITLSRNGYVTKSYTISVDGDKSDVTMSFSDLVEEKAQ